MHRDIKEIKMPNLRLRIIEKIQEYIKTYQTEPTKVYLTKKDEYDLLKLGTEDIGYEAVGLMCEGGPRAIENRSYATGIKNRFFNAKREE